MRTAPKFRPKLILIFWISLIWITFALLSLFANLSFDKTLVLKYTILWHSGWLIWIPLTYILIHISPRISNNRDPSKFPFLLHFFLAFGFAAFHLILEFIYNIPIRILIIGEGLNLNYQFIFGTLFGSKITANLLIYLAIVGVAHGFKYFEKYQIAEQHVSELNELVAEQKLQVLSMQLQPHFLFNAHNSIISLIVKNENQAAINMLTQLSELLRTTLEKTNSQFSSLEEELHIVQLYLNIQKERFQERLIYRIHALPELQACEVPSLLLQPLVENAIKHGIGPKIEGGTISISCEDIENKLQITIKDDGVGIKQSKEGIGIKTTRMRLQQLYPENHFFSVNPDGNGGTQSVVSIPLKKNEKEKGNQ